MINGLHTFLFFSPPNSKCLHLLMASCFLYLHSVHSNLSTIFLVILAWNQEMFELVHIQQYFFQKIKILDVPNLGKPFCRRESLDYFHHYYCIHLYVTNLKASEIKFKHFFHLPVVHFTKLKKTLVNNL